MSSGIQAESKSGTKLRTEPRAPVSAARCASMRASLAFMASMPPTASTANTARTITMPILMTNWTRSVHSTPHMPDRVEIIDVTAIRPMTMASASSLSTPKINPMIFTIARLTQPRMMQLIRSPRYTARKPRSTAAGRPA